ncbi:MAG: hypothetical protein KatS3mg016_0823 [Fimbriimonadales bacterium]|nr:MAG: hypothetical protein KatS3mg016_0823 [Fimbriimonadales bacterium]
MQDRIETGMLMERIRAARKWQDHQRLLFLVIHNKDTTLLKSLLGTYREAIAERPTPLLRWAYANCTCEIYEHNIHSLAEYAVKEERDFLKEEKVVEINKGLIKELPNQVIGYLGLARAYGGAFHDPELAKYYTVKSEGYTTIKVNGRTERIKKIVADNPERRRRYYSLLEKVRELEPNNPFVPFWQARSMRSDGKASDGYELAVKAYNLGMKQLSPIMCLSLVVWFAWKANIREAARYSEELRNWVLQAPKSAYALGLKYWNSCPLIKNALQ